MSVIFSVFSAMATDLTGHVDFPDRLKVQLGAPALAETNKNLPLLNIWSNKALPVQQTSDGGQQWVDEIMISFYTGVAESMETLVTPNAVVAAHLDVGEAIENRIMSAWNPGVPGLAPLQHEWNFGEILRGRVRGGVLGTEIQLRFMTWRG